MSIRPHVVLLTLSMCLIPALSWAQNGQNQQRPAGGTNIALIDVSYLFKNHKGFKDRGELIKKEVKDYDGHLAEQKKALTQKRAGLAEFKTGSPDYEKLEAEIAREAANLEVEAQLKRNDILEKEARLYYETYMQVHEAVQQFCEPRKIGLVLRFDGEEIDVNDRASVFRGVNRAVVYQDGIDITQDVLDMLNAAKPPQRQANAKTNTRPPQ